MSQCPYRILYVDDEPGLLEIGKLFLESDAEFSVDTFPSALAALSHLESENYDAIVSDYQMPKMDGLTFLKRLRAAGNTTPFIIFTGRGREEVVIEALNSGADFYLQKGGDPTAQFAELAHKIRRAVAKREADLALKKSERDYRHLIEHAGEAIFVTQDEVFRLVNPRAVVLSGYSEEELLGQPFARFVHRDDSAMLIDNFRKRMAGATISPRYIFRILRKDGALRWVELNVVVITWNDRPAILNFMTDITDRKLAEDALKESEERYRQFFRTTLDGLFITTLDGRWVDFNDAIVGMFGCHSREEVFSRPIRSFYLNPDDRTAIVSRVEQEGYVKEYPLSFRKMDGTPFEALMTVVALRNADGSTRMFIGTLWDITDTKRTENALRESEERYRQSFRTTLDGLFITTLDGRWVDFNDAIVNMLGFTGREEVFGTSIISLYVYQEERAVFIEHVEREGYVREYPVQLRKKDGDLIDVLMTVAPLKNPDGTTKALIGTIRDVTEQKRIEKALLESEERYRQFFRTTLDSMFITNPDGQFIDVNDALLKMYGNRSYEELLKINVASTWARPEERDGFLARVRQEGFVREKPIQFLREDGTTIDALISIAALKNPDGSVKTFIGTVRDISGQKRAEKALQEREEQYRHIFESFEDLYYQTDNNGIITLLSPSLTRNTDWTESELIGQPMTKMYASPEDRNTLLGEIARNGAVRDYEILMRKRDGTLVQVSVSATRIYKPDGNTAGIAGIIRDISRRKQAEDALRESGETFQTLVECAFDGCIILDFEGKILFANTAAASLADAGSAAGLVGRDLMEFIAPESRKAVAADCDRSRKTPALITARYGILTPAGRKKTVECRSRVITYKGAPANLVFLQEIEGHAGPGAVLPENPS